MVREASVKTMTSRRSTRRDLQAAATRRDILAAGRRLFAERGYAATTMTAIAEAAGAAVQTIYDSVGPKRAILLALLDVMDEEAGVSEFWRRVREAEDPREQLALCVNLTRQFHERCGDVIATLESAAPIERDAADAAREGGRRHRDGTRRLVLEMAAKGVLRSDLPVERAADILGFMTATPMYRQLVDDYGWTLDECEAWLTATVTELLLPAES
jgi:AcrR family transcriptional regulator